MLGGSHRCIADTVIAIVLRGLGSHDKAELILMQLVHSEVLHSCDVLVHLEELTSVNAQNGLTDLSKAAHRQGATAVTDTDREVVGGHSSVELLVA